MLGEAYMNVKKDTPSSNPIVNGSVPEESEYVRINTKSSRAREGRSWIVPWRDSCQGYLSARAREIRLLRTLPSSPHLIIIHASCSSASFLYRPSTIYTSPLMKNLCLPRETSDVSSRKPLKILSPKSIQISLGLYHTWELLVIFGTFSLLSRLIYRQAIQWFMKCSNRNWNITTSWLS